MLSIKKLAAISLVLALTSTNLLAQVTTQWPWPRLSDPARIAWRTMTVHHLGELLAHNAVNERAAIGGVTALMYAAGFNENPQIVQTLLDAGANVHARDQVGLTALLWAAAYNRNPTVLEMLLDAGLDVNAMSDVGSALMQAAGENDCPVVLKTLLEAGADVNARNALGETALFFVFGGVISRNAPNRNNAEVLKTLLDAGVMVNVRERFRNDTALMLAVRRSDNPAMIELLIDAGADVTMRNREGQTAWDIIQGNDALKNTEAYWTLNDLRFR